MDFKGCVQVGLVTGAWVRVGHPRWRTQREQNTVDVKQCTSRNRRTFQLWGAANGATEGQEVTRGDAEETERTLPPQGLVRSIKFTLQVTGFMERFLAGE